jgi:hypothetical protein
MKTVDGRRLKRSYTRNLGWCRFWLGIGAAVATFTFSFTVDRVFDPLINPAPVGKDDRTVQSNGADTDQIPATEVLIVALLLLSALICVVISWRFREQYRANDAALVETEQTNLEGTP